MKHAVRITKIITITVIVALLLPLTAFLANLAANNFVLAVYNHKIGKIKLPDNTEVVNSGKMVGNFFGNGDSLDFLVYYNVKTDMSAEQLRQYFDGMEIPPAHFWGKGGAVCVDKDTDRNEIPKTDGCISIIFIDEGYIPLLDIRGS